MSERGDIHDVRLALSKLSAEFRRRDDSRQYGVNCALRVIDGMANGDSVAVAIDRLLPGYATPTTEGRGG